MLIKKAVCMHEEDAGMAWKHVEYRTGHSEVRRMRRLVVSFVATIANYEYGFAWHLYQARTENDCQKSPSSGSMCTRCCMHVPQDQPVSCCQACAACGTCFHNSHERGGRGRGRGALACH